MPNKKYTLVAWTEKGEVRMIPSLVNELSAPYREKIESIEAKWQEVENEVGWLIAQSKAHEQFAQFLLRSGYPKEAFIEYSNAAEVCSFCSDRFLRQGVRGDFPTLPLLHRFLAMHRECMRLIKKVPSLKLRYEGSQLESLYLWFTLDERDWDEEFEEAQETRRAWRFGRAS